MEILVLLHILRANNTNHSRQRAYWNQRTRSYRLSLLLFVSALFSKHKARNLKSEGGHGFANIGNIIFSQQVILLVLQLLHVSNNADPAKEVPMGRRESAETGSIEKPSPSTEVEDNIAMVR